METIQRQCNGGPHGSSWCGVAATLVARAADGLEWWCCDKHTEGADTIPLETWFERQGLPGQGGVSKPDTDDDFWNLPELGQDLGVGGLTENEVAALKQSAGEFSATEGPQGCQMSDAPPPARKLVSVWAQELRARVGPTLRSMLPSSQGEQGTLEDYLAKEAELGDLAAVFATELLIAGLDVKQWITSGPEVSLAHVSLDGRGRLSLHPHDLGRLLLERRRQQREAVDRAAGEALFLLADVKRRNQWQVGGRAVIRWWAADNAGYETTVSGAGRYPLGRLLGGRWRYSGGVLCIPEWIVQRLARADLVADTAANWKTLTIAALPFEQDAEALDQEEGD